MKKFYNYTFQLVCIYILVLSLFSIFSFDVTNTKYDKKVQNSNNEKMLDSALLVQNLINKDEEEEKEESIKEDSEPQQEEQTTESEEKQEEEVVEEAPSPVEISNVNIIDTSSYPVLASETVNISHYGHDCYGCYGGQTSSGYYIGDGRTYYNDPTFGSAKVVAADYKYPEGTILRLNYYGNSVTAIVLDRGGAVGDHGKYQIDLLASSESEASRLGVIYNATLEVLRYGY